jgi:serine/threonine protein kinase/Flp pilus assembly protein TadD
MVVALESYLEALRGGRPMSRDEFLDQHSEISETLGECLSVLEFIQGAAVQVEGPRELAEAIPSEPIASPARLGDYRILREVGRGGMGVVYEAQQISLGRRVALKVLPFAAAIDPKQRQRFQIEAQAAAQLHHPHIVPVFGVGCDQGIHYYAMQFVDGRSLSAIIHELRRDQGAADGGDGPSVPRASISTEEATASWVDPHDNGLGPATAASPCAIERGGDEQSSEAPASGPRSGEGGPPRSSCAIGPSHRDRQFCRNVARLGIDAADALDHAHGLGILHRDIKPANLLIDPHGAVWITDFGLARFPNEFSLTGSGDMIGTLRYMSPEQALARRGVVDQRTDIYSLGVTLYELLTLRPAFDGRDHQELLRQIATDEPVPPRRLNPAIPRDLETIVLKAMAKDLSQRYATAQELAADLRRFLADEPIQARRPGLLERTLRWSRRHREVVATAVSVVVVSLAISTTLIWAQARETRIQAANAKEEAKKAKEARNAYHDYMIESYPLIDKFAMGEINQALGQAKGVNGPPNREEALRILDQWLNILRRTSELPLAERDSRIVVGRACTRLGYARALKSMALASPDGRLEATLLAQATEDFRKAIALFDELLAASPADANVRRYQADALGLFGMGCCYRFAHRNGEADACYRKAIELRRDLIRGPRSGGHVDVDGEVDNFQRLVGTVEMLAGTETERKRHAEAERLIRQLDDDVSALAALSSRPEFQRLRTMLIEELMKGSSAAVTDGRRLMIRNCRWALILDPKNAYAHNNLAWALVSVPDDPWFDSKQALDLARKAVDLNPLSWAFWNTLGVAAYRARDYKTAADSLHRSIQLNSGGAGFDCFFLAMTRWRQGQKSEARQWFDRAVAWVERTKSDDSDLPELRRFHVEAATLLGLPCPKPPPGTGGGVKAEARMETSRHQNAPFN